MKWRTEYQAQPSKQSFEPNYRFLFAGSCFADHMARKHLRYRMETFAHPNGIVFHPIALMHGLLDALQHKAAQGLDWVHHDGLWHSMDHHGTFSHGQKEVAVALTKERSLQASEALHKANVLCITWGTAFGFVYNKTGRVVANCHKIPGQHFSKMLAEHSLIEEVYDSFFTELFEATEVKKVVLTVSPVRYLKDGFVGNQRSKANLILAANALADRWDQVEYFPAYECMIDDLRDYRFVEADLVHPSIAAVEYIWEKWLETYFRPEHRASFTAAESLLRQLEHKPLHKAVDEASIEKRLEEVLKW